jgi:hypothetical protein
VIFCQSHLRIVAIFFFHSKKVIDIDAPREKDDKEKEKDKEKDKAASSALGRKKKRELIAEIEEMQHKLNEMQFAQDGMKLKISNSQREIERWRRLWMMTVGAEPSVETSRQLQGSAACWAAGVGSLSRLKAMLEYGGDVYQPDADGRTALHIAAAENHIEIARFLLQSGAHLKKTDRWGDNPSNIAIKMGLESHGAMAELLEVSETTTSLKELQLEYETGNYIAIGHESAGLVHIPKIQRKISKFFGAQKQPSPPSTMNAKSGNNPANYGQNLSTITSALSGEWSIRDAAAARSVRWSSSDKISPLPSARGANNATTWNSTLSLVTPPSTTPNPLKSPPPRTLNSSAGTPSSYMFDDTVPAPPSSRAGSRSLAGAGSSSDDLWSPPSRKPGKDKKDKDKKRKSNKFLASLMRNLLRDNGDGDESSATGSSAQSKAPTGKSKQTAAPFGVVHGVLRGACQVPDCDCKYFKKSANGASTTCSCGHFPASHLNLGEADILEGLEHLKVVDEASIAVLVPKDLSGGLEGWPRVLNSNLQGDEDTEILNQMWSSGSKGASASPVAQWVIPASDLLFTRQIGSGTSATVYEGVYKDKIVAIKLISFKPSDKRPREKQRQELIEEFNVMTSIENSHVISFFGVVTEPRLCLVIEYCSRGALYDVLSHGANADDPPPPAAPPAAADGTGAGTEVPPPIVAETVDWPVVFRWFREAVEGVNALHQRKPPIVHRDLKSLNLLLNEDNVVKVADFGLSRFLSEEDNNQTTLAKLRGTYAYCSPEVYFGEFFSPKSDVYSLGVILWELVTRLVTGKYYRPYGDYSYIQFDFQIIIQAAKKFCRPTIPPETPAEIASLIRLLWAPKPESRPDCPTLLNMIKVLEESYSQHKEEWDALVGTGAALPPLRSAPNAPMPAEWSMVQTSSASDNESGSRSGSMTTSTDKDSMSSSGSLSSSGHLSAGSNSKSSKRKSDVRPKSRESRDADSTTSPRSGSGSNESPFPLASSGSSSNVLESSRGSKASRLLGTAQQASSLKPSERTLRDILTDLNLFNEFKAFMAARYNSENLLFWEDVNKFKAMPEETSEDKRFARAVDIYEKYISGEKFDQQYVVSISPATTRDLMRTFKKREAIDFNVFNQAFDEVEHVTLKPSFNEFVRLHN